MNRLRVFAFAACALAAAAATAQDEPKKKPDAKPSMVDADKLVGSYKITGGKKAGEKLNDDAMKAPVTFTKDKISMKSMETTFAFSYKLDTAKTPATIELTGLEPDIVKDQKTTGIIKMEDGKLTLVYHPMGKETPKKFESTEDNGFLMFEMAKADKKGKKGKKKDKDGDN